MKSQHVQTFHALRNDWRIHKLAVCSLTGTAFQSRHTLHSQSACSQAVSVAIASTFIISQHSHKLR